MMQWFAALLALFCITEIAGETVYIEDLNNDHEKRNLDFGLPDTLNFRLRHAGGILELNLEENKRLNTNAPIMVPQMDSLGKTRALRVNVAPNKRVKFYQDKNNGAYISGECYTGKHGPCTRVLTGNLHIDGKEYKVEPVSEGSDKRELLAHVGTAHSMERLERITLGSDATDSNGQNIAISKIADLDYVVPNPDISEDISEESKLSEAKENLLEQLLKRMEKLSEQNGRTKRAIVAHGVEMLLAIDHVIYEEFATRYSGESEILFRIRQYYSHIINGVDLRYASIQEDDISFYITIAGFFISRKEEESPWLDYGVSPTDGLAGLKYMRTWRSVTDDLPEHDHACFITGSDIQASGSSGVVGIAYLNGVCSNYGVSINEEFGFFKGAGVLAHELGHNLGARHDSGADGSGCSASDDFIMEPYVPYLAAGTTSITPWRFSPCSIQSFRTYVNSMGTGSCTLDPASVWDDDEFKQHTNSLAGKLYSENEQCELLRGDGAIMCTSNKNTEAVCREFRCKDSGSNSCYRYVAAHGTPCGTNMMCFEGLCQAVECVGRECGDGSGGGGGETTPSPDTTTTTLSPETTTTFDDNFYCYDRGVGGLDCPDILNLMGYKPKLCKLFWLECCETCKSKCKSDKLVKTKKQLTCSQLIDLYGENAACSMFTKECCRTCSF